MEEEHPNAVVCRRLYRALGSGDFVTARRLVDDDCVLHHPGDQRAVDEFWS